MLLYRFARAFCRAYFALRYGCRIEGLENIPSEGPVILVANHISYLDPPLMGAAVERPVYFMAKAELFRNRLIAKILHRFNAFPVERGAADRKAIRRSLEVLSEGNVLVMFPEGTRSRTGELLPGQSGVAMLALRSRATVIPAGISGTSKEDRKLHPPTGRPIIALHFGPPVPLDDLYEAEDRRGAMREAVDRVMKAIRNQVKISQQGRIPVANVEREQRV